MFQFNPHKSTGLDEYNANFFQNNWSIVCSDITEEVQELLLTEKLLKEANHTFVTLIP